MASRNQRIIFLTLAALVAVVATVLAVSSGGDEEVASRPAQTTSEPSPTATDVAEEAEPQPTETAEPTPEPTPEPPLLTGRDARRLTFKKGDTVRFRVRSDVPEEVHVHAYDIRRRVEPGKTVTISFKADIDGLIEVEFERSHTPIAQLRIEP